MPRPRTAVPLAALLLLATAGVATAQSESPAASEPPVAVESPAGMSAAGAELAALVPESLGGQPTSENLQVRLGTELIADLDPADPNDASDIAQLEALAAALGAPMEELGSAATYVQTEDGGFALVSVFRAPGKDAALGMDFIIDSVEANTGQPRLETATYAGREVTLLYDDSQPEALPWYFVATGDTLWLIMATEPLLAEFFDSLP